MDQRRYFCSQIRLNVLCEAYFVLKGSNLLLCFSRSLLIGLQLCCFAGQHCFVGGKLPLKGLHLLLSGSRCSI